MLGAGQAFDKVARRMAQANPPAPTGLPGQQPQGAGLSPTFTVTTPDGPRELDIYTPEGYRALAELWTRSGWHHRVTYEVAWTGIPIIQLPEDIVMMQELIWRLRPDVIVESGVAHGGALMLYASIMELIGRGRVIGVDIEIRKYNRLAIEGHPLSHRIELIEADSTAGATLDEVRSRIGPRDSVMVALDSNHTKAHVAAELERYAPLVTPGSYMVVFDTVMAVLADAPNADPSWADDNPLEAVREFLEANDDFELDPALNRLPVTYCHGGYLRRKLPAARS
jgi:cephalosporin hydroxylase